MFISDVTAMPPLDDELSPFNMSYAMSIVPEGPHICIDDGGFNGMCKFGDEIPTPSYDAVGQKCIDAVVKVMIMCVCVCVCVCVQVMCHVY